VAAAGGRAPVGGGGGAGGAGPGGGAPHVDERRGAAGGDQHARPADRLATAEHVDAQVPLDRPGGRPRRVDDVPQQGGQPSGDGPGQVGRQARGPRGGHPAAAAGRGRGGGVDRGRGGGGGGGGGGGPARPGGSRRGAARGGPRGAGAGGGRRPGRGSGGKRGGEQLRELQGVCRGPPTRRQLRVSGLGAGGHRSGGGAHLGQLRPQRGHLRFG